MMLEDAFVLSNDRIFPKSIIKKIEEMIRPRTELKGLKFNINVADSLPAHFYGDSRRLIQVLLNLCSNSVKYTFTGSIDLVFEVKPKKKLLVIKVSDTGIGIGKVELEQLNKLFGLLDKKLINNETGIGLGLTVSKGIIKAMNGSVIIDSKIGNGTTCKVCVPIDGIISNKEDDDKTNTDRMQIASSRFLSDSEAAISLNSNVRNSRSMPLIMVVDDEPFVLLAFGKILSKLGCYVDKASNGEISVKMVREKISEGKKYDLIFMDANMPVMSGYEAAQIISSDKRVTTPIICVSAQDSAQHRKKCTECGMNDILSKPCSAAKLNEILKKYKLV